MFAIQCSSRTLFVGAAIILSTVVAAGAVDETASIEGKILFKGKPVTEGKVAFHPEKGKPIEVTIREDGAYSADKVPVGEMKITVDAKGVPAKYADPKKTPLRCDVEKGRNTFNLELSN
jgi:hypothetical protein